MITVEVRGWDRVANNLRRMASKARPTIDKEVHDWAQARRKELKGRGYPSPKRGKQPPKTDRQRRFLHALGRSGGIPYRRSGRLANSWKVERDGTAAYTVTNSQSYAALVVGKGTQTGYHAGHWWVMQDVVQSSAPKLSRDIAAALIRNYHG